MHFGLKEVSELPSLKEFEELARRALGSEWTAETAAAASEGSATQASTAPGGDSSEAPSDNSAPS